MQLTLQACEIRRFREIVSWIVRNPGNMWVHFVAHRGKAAMATHGHDWTLVVPVKGRRPVKPFKIPLRYLTVVPGGAEGDAVVKIDTKKRTGQVHWRESCVWKTTHPFDFSLEDYSVRDAPPEPENMNEYPVSLLGDLWRSTKPCMKTSNPYLNCIHVTLGGELRSSDGKYALTVQTPYAFDTGEKTLFRACALLGKKHLRRNKSFRMGFADDTVHFDFGDFCFFSKPNVERYPDLDNIFPKEETTQTRLTLDLKDAAFLKKRLDELPGRKDRDSPITLLCDYGGEVSVHGAIVRPEESKAILLAWSKYEGDAYVVRMNRKHLRQALSLGCLDFRFGTSYPFASTENVRLCWMPLDTCGALPLESERPGNPAVLLRSDEP